jgi:hypothetical protein
LIVASCALSWISSVSNICSLFHLSLSRMLKSAVLELEDAAGFRVSIWVSLSKFWNYC